MALADLALPTVTGWSSRIGDSLPSQLRWALFALNFSWSAIILGVGVLMVYAARLHHDVPFVRATLFVVSLFWAVHGIYMTLFPMPVTERLAWIQGAIVAFPAAVIGLLWVALSATSAQRPARPAVVS